MGSGSAFKEPLNSPEACLAVYSECLRSIEATNFQDALSWKDLFVDRFVASTAGVKGGPTGPKKTQQSKQSPSKTSTSPVASEPCMKFLRNLILGATYKPCQFKTGCKYVHPPKTSKWTKSAFTELIATFHKNVQEELWVAWNQDTKFQG
jgi:hypothetical protein